MKIQLLTNNILDFHVRCSYGHVLELDCGMNTVLSRWSPRGDARRERQLQSLQQTRNIWPDSQSLQVRDYRKLFIHSLLFLGFPDEQ